MLKPSEPFASYLVQTRSSCWVDIRDTTDEIIMHQFIVPVTRTPHADDVYIEVFQFNSITQETNEVDAVVKYDDEGRKEKSIVYIDIPEEENYDQKIVEYVLKLEVRKEAGLYDLQYVMDAMILPELDEDDDEDESKRTIDEGNEDTPRMKAAFTHRNGCDNLRAYGRKRDSDLKLKIQIPAGVLSSGDVDSQGVEVVTAWACGHEAVTLTHAVEFRVKPYSRNDIIPSKNEL